MLAVLEQAGCQNGRVLALYVGRGINNDRTDVGVVMLLPSGRSVRISGCRLPAHGPIDHTSPPLYQFRIVLR